MDGGCISGKITDKELVKIPALKECSTCGDEGFSSELFQCRNCMYRMQHRYCSNRYPHLGPDHQMCNWCEADVDNRATARDFKEDHVSRPRTTEIHWYGYNDSLTYLLKVAQSAANGNLPPAKPAQSKVHDHDAATILLSKSLRRPAQQHCRMSVDNRSRMSVKKWKSVRRRKLPLASTASKGITERRYKLLSDILC